MDERLSTNEAAKFLGVSTSTLYRMEKQGLIEPVRTPGGQRRFLREQLETYLTQSKSIKAPQNPSQYKAVGGLTMKAREQRALFEVTAAPPVATKPKMQDMVAYARRDFRRDYAIDEDIKGWLAEWEFRKSNTKTYTHGFHTYPAMFIPQIARKLILAFSEEGDTMADIFCGSGTALVEAKLLGRHSIGIELNPLAVLIAKVKTTPLDPQRLIEAYQRVLEAHTAKPFVPVSFPQSSNIDFWFSPQAIGELNALKQAILSLPDFAMNDFSLVMFGALMCPIEMSATERRPPDKSPPRNQPRRPRSQTRSRKPAQKHSR
jgi:excisionase family DNA binding protein